MVTGHGQQLLLFNGYAPSNHSDRESYFTTLSDIELKHDGQVLYGGDFNCTLCLETDRSYKVPAAIHDSKGLRTLLDKWHLIDVLNEEIYRANEEQTVAEFHRRHHTYHYLVAEGVTANSRFDRWYISDAHDDWIRTVEQQIPGLRPNHNGVSVRITPPDKILRLKRSRTVYPTPHYAAKQTEEITEAFMEEAVAATRPQDSTSDYNKARRLTTWWDHVKLSLKRILETVKRVKASMENGYRQRLQRLHSRLNASLLAQSTICVEDTPNPSESQPLQVHSIIAQTIIIRSLHRLRNDGFHGRTGPRDDHTRSVLRAYVSIFTKDTHVPRFLPSDSNHQDRTEYLMFFDGGLRGNPGPGGAGAVIVHLNQNHHAASATWVASMAYANKTTPNNVAEYRGLLIGLRHAYNHALKPLHVTADSAMVITQQCIHKSPTNPQLAALYQATKALADVLGVQSWPYHYRECNKMTDCVANAAMDTHHSQQVKVPSARPPIKQVAQHLHSDVEHWVTQTQD